MEDPNAPYKQCAFIYNTNGRKCCNPAVKLDHKDTAYCNEHTRRAQLARIKSTAKHAYPQTPEGLILNLQHYSKPSLLNSNGNGPQVIETQKLLDPFSKSRFFIFYSYSFLMNRFFQLILML